MNARAKVPEDFEVQPLAPGDNPPGKATCGTCGLSWNDSKPTTWTPTPSGRCPFEYFHVTSRAERLMPDGIPRWIRCYDGGDSTADRYAVIFTKGASWGGEAMRGRLAFRGMSAHPTHPQGFGQWGEAPAYCDGKPAMRERFGKRIAFQALPPDCQRLVLSDYRDIWGLA
jgi:hypothetical protein